MQACLGHHCIQVSHNIRVSLQDDSLLYGEFESAFLPLVQDHALLRLFQFLLLEEHLIEVVLDLVYWHSCRYHWLFLRSGHYSILLGSVLVALRRFFSLEFFICLAGGHLLLF